MLLILSPAKTLDFTSSLPVTTFSLPDFLDQSQQLIEQLRDLSPSALASLMGISDSLATLNADRYAAWSLPFSPENARQAVFAFNGDVYEGLQAASLSPSALQFAQGHLRILSGLYGVLRPLDLIQPYRLEMGTALANHRGKDLYAFWGERLVTALNAAVTEIHADTLVNLASSEYFKAARLKKLAVPVVQPVFEDWSNGRFKVVSFYAKRARGLMARHVLTQRLESVEGLKSFAAEGYAFDPAASDAGRWVFRRKLASAAAAVMMPKGGGNRR